MATHRAGRGGDGRRHRAVGHAAERIGWQPDIRRRALRAGRDRNGRPAGAGSVEHVIGSEARSETGELHALDEADPMDQQAITWCFPMSYLPGEDHTIDKPRDYDFWRTTRRTSGRPSSFVERHPSAHEPQRHLAVFAHPGEDASRDFWHYRRIVDASSYPEGWTSDVTLVNWPQIDYWLGPLVGVDAEERQKHLDGARQLEPLDAVLDADRGAAP